MKGFVQMEELKNQIEVFIKNELSKGVRKANLEIDLIHFVKRALYSEEEES